MHPHPSVKPSRMLNAGEASSNRMIRLATTNSQARRATSWPQRYQKPVPSAFTCLGFGSTRSRLMCGPRMPRTAGSNVSAASTITPTNSADEKPSVET